MGSIWTPIGITRIPIGTRWIRIWIIWTPVQIIWIQMNPWTPRWIPPWTYEYQHELMIPNGIIWISIGYHMNSNANLMNSHWNLMSSYRLLGIPMGIWWIPIGIPWTHILIQWIHIGILWIFLGILYDSPGGRKRWKVQRAKLWGRLVWFCENHKTDPRLIIFVLVFARDSPCVR